MRQTLVFRVSRRLRWVALAGVVLALVVAFPVWRATSMPGKSYVGPEPTADGELREMAARMQDDLGVLAGDIGERNTRRPVQLAKSADFLQGRLGDSGYAVRRESFEADGTRCDNLITEVPGTSGRWVVVGAHYDSARGSPGANDNGTGVVALLELARALREAKLSHGLRLVLFVNEEPPFFHTDKMGSQVHVARSEARGDNIVAMLSLETMGRFDDTPGSQKYPAPFSLLYPDRGNFVAFVGDSSSRDLVRSSVKTFREHAKVPSEGAALPRTVPGVDWSDHASFWRLGVPALMVTDTAPFRSEHYHTENDTAEHLDFVRLAETVRVLEILVRDLTEAQ